MRIGMALNYSGGFKETVAELADYEKAGLDIVFVAEAYSFDAVSQMGYIAAKTERLQIASGILPIYSRTPTLLAMTAAGIDYVSDGRFMLGLGASGPQVIEGFHGVPYDRAAGPYPRDHRDLPPGLAARDGCSYDGQALHASRCPQEQGTGLGKPLKLINHPVRDRIPIVVAAIGPKNVELTAELAEGWEPLFYMPEKAAGRLGRRPRRGHGQARPGAGRAGRRRPGGAGDRRRRARACWSSAARWRPSTSAAWAPRARTSTTTWPAATATRRRPSRSRTSTSTARRTRPPRSCPTSCSRRCR